MRIDRVDIIQIQMPVVRPYETSYGTVDKFDRLVLKFYTADFPVYTDCASGSLIGFSYETLGTARDVLKNHILPAVMGKTINGPEDFPRLCKGLPGHPMAKASVENAFWILKAMALNVSLAELIGNRRDRLEAGAGVGIQRTPEELIDLVGKYLNQGYTKIKMKIKPGVDRERIEAVRKAYPEISLMVDANNAYSTADIDALKDLDHFGLLMIEQPLEEDNILGHAKLQAGIKTPVGLDESIRSPFLARMAIEMKACRCINIKQCRVGGLAQAIEIHDICRRNGVGVWCGGMMETGPGRAVLLALSGLPNFIYPLDIGDSHKYFFRDIISPPFTLNDDATLTVPRGTGLGVDVDEKALEDFTVAREILRV